MLKLVVGSIIAVTTVVAVKEKSCKNLLTYDWKQDGSGRRRLEHLWPPEICDPYYETTFH